MPQNFMGVNIELFKTSHYQNGFPDMISMSKKGIF